VTTAVPARRFGPSALATPANAVTVVRLVATVPLLVLILARGASWATVLGWIGLGSTDGFDGWLARRDGTTRSGAFLDPLADKVLIIGGLAAMAVKNVFAWAPVLLIACREIGISIYRSLAGRRGISLPARGLGKLKTVCQLVAVGFGLLPLTAHAHGLHSAMLWFAVSLTLVSGFDIVRQGWVEARA
jgi:CDP-diacylglycerol--glycerol-3-phosphate 3-phosphatidyltransferase